MPFDVVCGVEWSGVEWSGVEWNGMECFRFNPVLTHTPTVLHPFHGMVYINTLRKFSRIHMSTHNLSYSPSLPFSSLSLSLSLLPSLHPSTPSFVPSTPSLLADAAIALELALLKAQPGNDNLGQPVVWGTTDVPRYSLFQHLNQEIKNAKMKKCAENPPLAGQLKSKEKLNSDPQLRFLSED
jgi:hypothetical protein